MKDMFNLEDYLSRGIEDIVKGALKASFSNPKESIFITKYSYAIKHAHKLRMEYESSGQHIPPFLIASITGSCNLHCAGCYARANHICADKDLQYQLTAQEWERIFTEAKQLGICFILLAGGEPLLRPDVVNEAAKHKGILFPVFTNGVLISEDYLKVFDSHRNLVPIISIEGNEENTDLRRGKGVYVRLLTAMDEMKKKGILFGASITVTKDNINEVTGEAFLHGLADRGCKAIIFVEYVPVGQTDYALAPEEEERAFLAVRLNALRSESDEMIYISFPGDEKSSDGCLAAGRGFFHINPSGRIEPCPFSPFSDTDIREKSLLNALKSPLFAALMDNNMLIKEHTGGCVLFEQEEEVRKLLQGL